MHATKLLRLVVLAAVAAAPQPVTAEENQGLQKDPAQLFGELDKNGDGKLTADELSAKQKGFFDHLLRVAGKDKDGELTKAEFLKALAPDDLKVAAPRNLGGPGGGFPPNPNRLFQQWDANKDGKLTLEEIPAPQRVRFKPMFDRLEKSELTRDEFVQAMERARGGGAFMRDPDGFFKQLDKNQDGKLTVEEAPEPVRPLVERWLARLGKDKDGFLTVDDLKKIVAENLAGNPGRPVGGASRPLPPFFRKLDTNGDGKLSKDELLKAPALMEELDLNKDGFLDPAELLGPPASPETPVSRENRNPAEAPAVKPAATAKSKPSGQRFDADGDGRIARSEARGKIKDNFDAFDTNGDGFLDRDEIRRVLQQVSRKQSGGKPLASGNDARKDE